jgi:hypothetical protein
MLQMIARLFQLNWDSWVKHFLAHKYDVQSSPGVIH